MRSLNDSVHGFLKRVNAVPAAVACPVARGLGAELRHLIQHRREFQWHLPVGVRIRFQDCPGRDVPTPDFHCESPTLAPSSRR